MAEKVERDEIGLRRSRKRETIVPKKKRQEIAQRVIDFAKDDEASRATDIDLRLQRYAKFRMWTEGGGEWPWEGSSDQGLPDLMTNVLALEDTLHNAVMSVGEALHTNRRDGPAAIAFGSETFLLGGGERKGSLPVEN